MEKSPEKVIFDQIVEMCKKTEQSVKNVLSNVLDKLILENEDKSKGDVDGDKSTKSNDFTIDQNNFISKMEGMKIDTIEESSFYSYDHNSVFNLKVKLLKRKGMVDKYLPIVTIREKNEFYRPSLPPYERYKATAFKLEETHTPESALGSLVVYLRSRIFSLVDSDRTLATSRNCTKEELEKEFNNVIDHMIKFYDEEVSNKEAIDNAD